jgi:putative colanic acid biosynthesis acetyltransferase WcaF
MNTILLYLYNLLAIFLPETRFFALKCWILKLAGVKIGKNVRICSSVRIIGNGKLSIGDDSWIGPQSLITCSFPAEVRIGSNVDIAPKVYIITGTHEIDMIGLHSAGKAITSSIVIEDGAWICACVRLLHGVLIGTKSIIGAGSIVTKDIPKFSLGAGNPCRIAKDYRAIDNNLN